MTTDRILIEQIQKEFGTLSYHPDGVINRKYLAERVFNEPEQLRKLNALVHPRVGQDYKNWVGRQSGKPYVLKEAALLFEAGSASSLDKVIAVYAPATLRVQRVLQRDPHRNEAAVREVMQNQMDEEEKRSRADFVILNDESTLIIPQVLDLHQRFSNAI